jgi:hypothetical protein
MIFINFNRIYNYNLKLDYFYITILFYKTLNFISLSTKSINKHQQKIFYILSTKNTFLSYNHTLYFIHYSIIY